MKCRFVQISSTYVHCFTSILFLILFWPRVTIGPNFTFCVCFGSFECAIYAFTQTSLTGILDRKWSGKFAIFGQGKPGKVREFHYAEVLRTMIFITLSFFISTYNLTLLF